MSTVATSEVLNRAADLIEERGWACGKGWSAEGGPLCIEGAIAAALGADGHAIRTTNTCPAGAAVREYLELGEYTATKGGLWYWNDELRWDRELGTVVTVRTANEVVEVLRATAVIEAAREQETVTLPAVEALPERTETREVVEWRCESVLAEVAR